MRVLGVDPGLTRCGFGVVDGGSGRTVTPIAVDVVRTPADLELSSRLLRISEAAESWIDLHRPEVVAIERVFSQHNVRTAMGTAQAGGVVALAAARRGIPVCFHTPSEVKAAVTGSGSADKAQVTAMVTRILKLASRTQTGRRGGRAGTGDLPLLAGADDRTHGPRRSRGRRTETSLPGPTGRSEEGRYTMIASVRGEVLEIALDHAVIESAGVGYRVNATPATLGGLQRGTEARLVTAMIVREDSMTLYGFPDSESKELFGLLQTVSGVGPRLAMATLAVLEPDALRAALAEGNVTALTRVPGIGKRGAERMVVELRDKVDAVASTSGVVPLGAAGGGSVRDQIVEALVGLGFPAKQAEQATDSVLAEAPESTTSTALRSALSLLGKTR